MARRIYLGVLIINLVVGFGCAEPYRYEPPYTHEQFVRDSITIRKRMKDSLGNNSHYVCLGFKLVTCDSCLTGRWVEHSFQSTSEPMPPVRRRYFQFGNEGTIRQELSEADFFAIYYACGDPGKLIVRYPYH